MSLSTRQSAYLGVAAFLAFSGFVWLNRDKSGGTPTALSVPTGQPVATTATETPALEPAAAPIAPKPRIPTTVAEAVAAWRGDMDDTEGKVSPGANRLIAWSMDHLRWSDMQTLKETSIALVAKDSDEERGRRLCVSGSIIEIRAQRVEELKIYDGGLMVGGDVVRFTAVGSTGSLVADGWARFCGVVTGVLSYKNTGGGTTHAVHAVGMFDLPANKEKK